MENKNLLKKKISEYIFPKENQKNYLEGKKENISIPYNQLDVKIKK